jgi:PHS family inorganic phosphate transporter-like MFS transporter
MSACFLALAICYNIQASKYVKFSVFCVLTLSLNWGPNIGTYVLPASLYPAEIKSTFHGLSAACGKIGALLGTFIFAAVSEAGGVSAVMWAQVFVCLACAYVSYTYIPKETRDNGQGAIPASAVKHVDYKELIEVQENE